MCLKHRFIKDPPVHLTLSLRHCSVRTYHIPHEDTLLGRAIIWQSAANQSLEELHRIVDKASGFLSFVCYLGYTPEKQVIV